VCGLAAVFAPAERASGALPALARMHALLSHRGPDGEGMLALGPEGRAILRHGATAPESLAGGPFPLAVGCRRLAIQDPTEASAQPFASADGRLFLAFNGEVYNHAEIRRELEAEGIAFRTRGDTEVVLAAYGRWGTKAFERFNGMWALLILDLGRRRLVGSRDRLGIKPLFHALDAGRLLLASEPRAIAAVMEDGPRVQAYRFRELLKGLPPQSAELSFFEGIHPIPPAAIFEIDLSASRAAAPDFTRFWDLADHVCDPSEAPEFERAAEELAGLLRSSVSLRLAADAKVGSFLSGGLDSSTVTRLMAGAGPAPYPAFSLVYDDPEMDESRFMDAVLEAGGIDARRETFAPKQAWEMTDAVVEAQGEPLLGWDLIAQHRAYVFARAAGVKVILEGQGGDELLGGYGVFEWEVLRDEIARGSLRGFAAELRGLASAYGTSSLRVLRFQAANRRRLRAWLHGDSRRPSWLRPEAAFDFGEAAEAGRSRDMGRDPSRLNRALYQSTRHTNLPGVLLHQDRNSMAHGIESRVPFLDHRVVERIATLPPEHKIHRGVRKRILRRAAREILPTLVTERRDKKAVVSTPRWIPLREHAEELRAMSRSGTMARLPWIDAAEAARAVDRYLAGEGEDHLAVWRLYSAWRWLEIFRPRV